MNPIDRLLLRGGVVAFLALAGAQAHAQDFGQAFEGFSSGSDDPIQIEADRLDVRDEQKMAIYSGRVRLRQGGTVLQTSELRVFYSGDVTDTAPGSSVYRIEAYGRVVVNANDRSASGDQAVFEMAKDLITLSGNVVVSDASNVVRGERLFVDLTTKKARIEGGRVQTIFRPERGGGN